MSTKSLSSSLPKIKIPFPPIIDLAELLQPNKSFSLFDEPHKPSRAPNAFIIYRKMFVKVAREEGHNLPMTAISSMASIAWEKEPERVKAEYKRISKEAHLKKKAMFPKDKKKRRKETWNVVSFQGPNLLKHYEINHDDDEELDEDSNDISVIINSDTNTTTTIYNNNYNHKKNNKNKNNDNNINNGSNNIDNNNNNSSSSSNSSSNSNHNSIDNNNNIYSNYYNNFYGSQFAIPAPIYSPETVELNLQNYSDSNNSSNNINNNNLFKEKFENRGTIFDSNFPLDIRNDENLDDLLDSFLYNQQQQQHHHHHHHQNYHQNDNQIQQMSYTMLLRQPITTTVDHDNNISLHQYIQLHHTPDLSSDESISGISSPSLSLNDAETVSSSNNNNGFVYSDSNNNIFNIYSNEDNSNNNDDDNIFLNIISPDNNDNNNDKMFDTIDYHY